MQKKSSIDGEGLGLYLAKSLCDLHDIGLSVNPSSSNSFMFNRITYSDFIVKMEFKRP